VRCAGARKGLVITGAQPAREELGTTAHHAPRWKIMQTRPSRRRLAIDRLRQRLLGPRSISRKPLIRPLREPATGSNASAPEAH